MPDNDSVKKNVKVPEISNCVSKGSVSGSDRFIGGIVGTVAGYVNIKNVKNYANIMQSAASDDPAAGGIIGKVFTRSYGIENDDDNYFNLSNVNIDGAYNYGNIGATNGQSHDNHAGGIIGICSTEDILTYRDIF